MSERGGFEGWYQRNRETYNARRRHLYHTDPEYRARVKRNMEKYREKKRAKPKKPTNLVVIDGVERTVHLIGDVSKMISRAPVTIRTWEKSGLIPSPSAPGKRRAYTDVQVQLMEGLRDVLNKYSNQIRSGKAKPQVEKAVEYINEHWRD